MDIYALPVTVDAAGQVLPIRARGDWRVIVDVNLALTDPELTEQERAAAALIIFYETALEDIQDLNAAVSGMIEFLAAGIPDDGPKRPALVDWEDDAALIVSGVNSVLGAEVRAVPYMHWWTFIAAYMAIGDSTLATVIGIRDKIARGRKLEKHEQDFKRDNPGYFKHRRQDAANAALLLELIGD